jgi:6-pyruvoyltetrahydropterin/6-carboxytetrahydropterin synthase
MIEVGIEAQFYATHALRGDFGKASLTHGHHYRVRAVFAGGGLNQDGVLVDITLIELALGSVVSKIEARHLNDTEPFTAQNPTAELLAGFLWKELEAGLQGCLPKGVFLSDVTLWESPQAFVRITINRRKALGFSHGDVRRYPSLHYPARNDSI